MGYRHGSRITTQSHPDYGATTWNGMDMEYGIITMYYYIVLYCNIIILCVEINKDNDCVRGDKGIGTHVILSYIRVVPYTLTGSMSYQYRDLQL